MDNNDDNSMKYEIVGEKEVRKCWCLELEERSLKAEARCVELESEIQKGHKMYEFLEANFKELESEKVAVDNELKNLKQSKPAPKDVVDLTDLDGEDSIVELTMVIKALECEKQVAETEVEIWRGKFEKLSAAVRKLQEMGALRDGEWHLDENVKLGLELAGIKLPVISRGKETEFGVARKEALLAEGLTPWKSSDSPYSVTPVNDDSLGRSRRGIFQSARSSRGRVRKPLLFEDDGNHIGPSTPANGKPASTAIVDLCDSDEEPGKARICVSTRTTFKPHYGSENESGSRSNSKESSSRENYEDEDVNPCEANTTSLPAHKRKRVICSDSECDDEDNIPIGKLKGLKPLNQDTPELNSHNAVCTPVTNENVPGRRTKRRLVLSRQSKQRVPEGIFASSKSDTKERLRGIPTTDDVQDDESEEESESANESKSLDGFIVDDNEESDGSHESRSDESCGDAPHESDEDIDYAGVISSFRRDRNRGKSKWEYEGEMLADFGKDPELCMRAVCVLYRKQTADEKASRSSHHFNNRGFNKFDAKRGTHLGEFLTDGDPNGDLKKTVGELRRFNAEAVELCRELATHYSKQLFQIYENKEDPFFTSP